MARRRRVNLKAKGINAERELVHLFHKFGWSAVRIAGSGSSKYPCPDVLAGNGFRRIAIEAKAIFLGKSWRARREPAAAKITALAGRCPG